MYGLPSQQNKAHREDMFWFKSGKGEYTHSSGKFVIRKRDHVSKPMWDVFDEEGNAVNHPTIKNYPLTGYSLTSAKMDVQFYLFDKIHLNMK